MTIWKGPRLNWAEDATLVSLLRAAAANSPRDTALIDAESGRTVTFAELDGHAGRAAGALSKLGVGRGMQVAVLAGNTVDLVATMLGAQTLRAAVSGINPSAPAAEISRQVSRLDASVILADAAAIGSAREAVSGPGGISVSTIEGLSGEAWAEDASRPEDIALLPFSSGTTGVPKPVIVTHGMMISAAASIATAFDIGSDSRILCAAPLFHIVGPLMLAVSLMRRVPLILVPRPDPALMLAGIEAHRATLAPILVPMLRILVARARRGDRDLSSLRLVAFAGSVPPPGLQIEAAELLRVPVIQVLGLTESSGALTADDRAAPVPDTVGRPLPGVEIRVADPETGALLGAGGTGELQVRGPMITTGFWGMPEATAELFTADGWMRTGDLVETDTDGRTRVRGRLKELIKVNAGQVAPVELEQILLTHPSVADAAVIGRPNAHTAEIPVAYVVWTERTDPFAVMEWVNEQVLSYKRIRAIESIEAIPRNPQGKILRRILAGEDALRTSRFDKAGRATA